MNNSYLFSSCLGEISSNIRFEYISSGFESNSVKGLSTDDAQFLRTACYIYFINYKSNIYSINFI